MSEPFDHLDNPYFKGFAKPVTEERDDRDLVIDGELPAGLEGVFLKNGPNPQFVPRGKYHPFDGDGMVHALHVEDRTARFCNRWVRTAGFEYERAAGKAVFGGFADLAPPPADAIQKVGPVKHVANTNVIAHAGKLLALWEGGMPYAMDAALETLGLEQFGSDYNGPFTAHPCKDAHTGELFAFGYAPFRPYLTLLVVDAEGKLLHRAPIEIPRPVMMHDFCITEQYAVFLDAPALFDIKAAMKGEPIVQWRPELGCRIGVMPRFGVNADVRWFEIEPCFVYHFMNAFEDGSKVCIDASRLPRLNSFGLEGTEIEAFQGKLTRFEVDLETGKVSTRQLFDVGFEFPRLRDDLIGRPYRYAYGGTFSSKPHLAEFDTTLKFDLAQGTLERYFHGAGRFVGETVFVPDPSGAAEDAGWLVAYVYDSASDKSDFVVLDARDVQRGPIATVHLRSRVPEGIHASWVPAAALRG